MRGRVRDRASYIQQTRDIARQTLLVLGFNALLWVLLVASGSIASPNARGSMVILALGLGSALFLPIANAWFDTKRKRARDYGLYLGLVGTTLLWGPIYLLMIFGDQPDVLMDLTYVGGALLFASVFWPTRSASE
jgi:hypothetical protein